MINQYCDSLGIRRSGDRMPVEVGFSAPIQTGPGAHLDTYAMSTEFLSREKNAVAAPKLLWGVITTACI